MEPTLTQNLKYSFKDKQFQTNNVPYNPDTNAQNREKMFRSIDEIRKSLSKDKKDKKK